VPLTPPFPPPLRRPSPLGGSGLGAGGLGGNAPLRVIGLDPVRQLSLFGVEAAEPSPTDLAGLLAGPGMLTRMGGTARVSVRVDAAWRVHALIPELVMRGFTASWLPVHAPPPEPPDRAEDAAADSTDDTEDTERPDDTKRDDDADHGQDAGRDAGGKDAAGQADAGRAAELTDGFEVRTAYSSRLSGLGRAWLDGTAKRAPDRFFLSGPRLRLWAVAAGSPRPGGYELRLGADDSGRTWDTVDAALTRAGVPGVVLDTSAVYRITGRRRLARLAELVGERPSAAPAGVWPGA
jgi:hypothetical protein